MLKNRTIAIIPARGGSKRIPQKNIRPFLDKPIIAYSIEAAQRSELFDEVMVSTDCQRVKQVALDYGAVVPFLRSSKNSNDFATTADVISEVIAWYENHDMGLDIFCCLYPTAPMITAELLRKSYDEFINHGFSSLVSICAYDKPIFRAFKIDSGVLKFKWPEYKDTRSQDLEKLYFDAGQFYWGLKETFQKEKTLITSNATGYHLPEHIVQDIDNISDWHKAERKFLEKANDHSLHLD